LAVAPPTTAIHEADWKVSVVHATPSRDHAAAVDAPPPPETTRNTPPVLDIADQLWTDGSTRCTQFTPSGEVKQTEVDPDAIAQNTDPFQATEYRP